MGYHYLEDFATADIAFEATGKNLEEVFQVSADATMNVMIEDIEAIEGRTERAISLENDDLEMLLFDFLQELIYYKDAQQLLLRIKDVNIVHKDGTYALQARAAGEQLDPERHEQRADVKAVTLHQFSLTETDGGWKALVILDI